MFFQQGDQAGILRVELLALLLFIGKLLIESFQPGKRLNRAMSSSACNSNRDLFAVRSFSRLSNFRRITGKSSIWSNGISAQSCSARAVHQAVAVLNLLI